MLSAKSSSKRKKNASNVPALINTLQYKTMKKVVLKINQLESWCFGT
ncbi:hypothetical protein ACJDT4_10855 [Clostridium neuense]|uniref:Transposase n=1 Tax=Clostridium neuense TaxID=1728934 RepID=A0ABW8TF30_9CLOT